MKDEWNLGPEDRPNVAQIVAIVRRMQWEDRLHRRVARQVARLWTTDWAAWWFRRHIAFARVQNASSTRLTKILQAEVDRVAAVVEATNAGVPREEHVRGKVWLPRGVFIVNKTGLEIPDSVDVVWPRAPRG